MVTRTHTHTTPPPPRKVKSRRPQVRETEKEGERETASKRTTQRSRAAPLASIKQMSRQVWRDSAGEYQADERAGVAGLSWRVSGR